MLSVVLAVVLALAIAAFLAFCLPVWASISITFAAVMMVVIGGGALLAKGSIAAAAVGVVVWLWHRHARRRAVERIPTVVNLLAIPEPKAKDARASQRRTERQAA